MFNITMYAITSIFPHEEFMEVIDDASLCLHESLAQLDDALAPLVKKIHSQFICRRAGGDIN